MDPEEQQRQIDEEARRAAAAQMAALGGVEEQTRDALSPVTGPAPHRVELAPDPELDRVTASEPVELPTRDHLGNEDPTSGSVFGPDYEDMPTEEPAAPSSADPANGLGQPWGIAGNAETFGAATDTDPVLPGVMADEPEAIDNPTEEGAEATAALDVSSPEMRALDTEEQRGEAPRLDVGLPSEEEIGSAHTADDFRRPLHALGAMFLGAGGRSVPAFEERAAPLEQERRAGLRQALASKGAARATEATQAATSARQQIQDAMAERGLAIRQQQADAATRASEQRGGLVEAQTERTRAQTEAERLSTAFSRATREERQSAQSGLSRGYQAAIRERAGLIGIQPPEGLESQSAEQLEPQMRAMMQGVGVRRGAGGSGAASGRGDSRVGEAMRMQMFPDEAAARAHLAAVGSDNFDRELVNRQNEMTAGETAASRSRVPLAEGEQGEEVFPGLHAGIRLGTGEGRAIRHDIGAVAGRMASLGRMRQIGEEFGWSGAISPEAAARVRPRLMALRSMAAQIQGTGVINPSEVETINASLPDPTDLEQMTFGTLRAALDEWQGMLEDTVRGNVGETGIGIQEGADALIRRLRTAADRGEPSTATPSPRTSPSRAPTASDGRVRVRRRSDGRAGSVTPSFLAAHADEYEELR